MLYDLFGWKYFENDMCLSSHAFGPHVYMYAEYSDENVYD